MAYVVNLGGNVDMFREDAKMRQSGAVMHGKRCIAS